MSFLSTWCITIRSDLSTLLTTAASTSTYLTSLLDTWLTQNPAGCWGSPIEAADPLWAEIVNVKTVKELGELLKTQAIEPGKEVFLTLSSSMNDRLNSLPEITASIISRTPPPSPTIKYIWDVLQANLGMPILIMRSLSFYVLFLCFLTVIPGFLNKASARVLRWPILLTTYFQIAVELSLYAILRMFIKFMEFLFQSGTHRRMRREIWESEDYEEWLMRTRKLDKSQGRDWWQRTVSDDVSSRYNWAFIRELMKDLKEARQSDDLSHAIGVLNHCTRKNVGGVMSNELFAFTNSGEPKFIVGDFVEEVCETIRWITDRVITEDGGLGGQETNFEAEVAAASLLNSLTLGLLGDPGTPTSGHHPLAADEPPSTDSPSSPSPPAPSSSPPKKKKRTKQEERQFVEQVLRRARAAYGRTGLCLSGGAAMGTYHFGIVKGLFDQGILPHILSGTSAGAVVGAFVGTRTDEEIERDLTPETLELRLKSFGKGWIDLLTNLYMQGTLFENEYWMQQIAWFAGGDMTFAEAYKKTGRILCITLSAVTKKAPPVLLNYVTAPNVTIGSAVCASAAVPGFVKAMRLRIKDENGKVHMQEENKDQLYFDGSIDQDIPTAGLAEMFNCQFFLAAQANPHIVPFLYNSKGDVGRPSRWSVGSREDSWRGGYLLAALELYLKYDMKAKFNFLGDLEAAVGFTGTLMTQNNWGTTTGGRAENQTTMVPQVAFQDYFKLISDPKLNDLYRYMRGGQIAAYEKTAFMKTHYSIAHTLNECLAKLTKDPSNVPAEAIHNRAVIRRKRSIGRPLPTPTILGSPQAAFTFSGVGGYKKIEENGEMDNGDNEVEAKYATPSLVKRTPSENNLMKGQRK